MCHSTDKDLKILGSEWSFRAINVLQLYYLCLSHSLKCVLICKMLEENYQISLFSVGIPSRDVVFTYFKMYCTDTYIGLQ